MSAGWTLPYRGLDLDIDLDLIILAPCCLRDCHVEQTGLVSTSATLGLSQARAIDWSSQNVLQVAALVQRDNITHPRGILRSPHCDAGLETYYYAHRRTFLRVCDLLGLREGVRGRQKTTRKARTIITTSLVRCFKIDNPRKLSTLHIRPRP